MEFSKFSGKAAEKYLESKSSTNYSTYTITDITDEAVAKVADNLLGSSDKIISRESGYSFMTNEAEIKVPDGGTTKGVGAGDRNLKSGEMAQGGRYSYDIRNVGTYNPISNNCGTVVSELFYMAGSKTFTKQASYGYGTAPIRYITPNALKKYLDKR